MESYLMKIRFMQFRFRHPLRLMVGNKKLFEEAGLEFPTESWTEEEFRDAAVKMTDESKRTVWNYVWRRCYRLGKSYLRKWRDTDL